MPTDITKVNYKDLVESLAKNAISFGTSPNESYSNGIEICKAEIVRRIEAREGTGVLPRFHMFRFADNVFIEVGEDRFRVDYKEISEMEDLSQKIATTQGL